MSRICGRAIAYLKFEVRNKSSQTEIPGAVNEQNAPVIKRLKNGMCVAYVLVSEHELIYVQYQHLINEGIDVDTLHEIGMRNLRTYLDGHIKIQKHGSIFGVQVDGNFEASLVLLDELWDRELTSLVDSGFVIAIPSRDVLAFCDVRSEEGIAILRQMISRVSADGDHLLSKSLFFWKNGYWMLFD